MNNENGTSEQKKDRREICACCNQPIEWGQKVVAVRYGIITASVRHTTVSKDHVDYFHVNCDKAFREDVKP